MRWYFVSKILLARMEKEKATESERERNRESERKLGMEWKVGFTFYDPLTWLWKISKSITASTVDTFSLFSRVRNLWLSFSFSYWYIQKLFLSLKSRLDFNFPQLVRAATTSIRKYSTRSLEDCQVHSLKHSFSLSRFFLSLVFLVRGDEGVTQERSWKNLFLSLSCICLLSLRVHRTLLLFSLTISNLVLPPFLPSTLGWCKERQRQKWTSDSGAIIVITSLIEILWPESEREREEREESERERQRGEKESSHTNMTICLFFEGEKMFSKVNMHEWRWRKEEKRLSEQTSLSHTQKVFLIFVLPSELVPGIFLLILHRERERGDIYNQAMWKSLLVPMFHEVNTNHHWVRFI